MARPTNAQGQQWIDNRHKIVKLKIRLPAQETLQPQDAMTGRFTHFYMRRFCPESPVGTVVIDLAMTNRTVPGLLGDTENVWP